MLPTSLLHHFKLLLYKPRILDLTFVFFSYIHRSRTFSDLICFKCGICKVSFVQYTHTHTHTHTHPYTAHISFYNSEDRKNNNKKGYWLYFCMTTKMVRNDQIVVFHVGGIVPTHTLYLQEWLLGDVQGLITHNPPAQPPLPRRSGQPHSALCSAAGQSCFLLLIWTNAHVRTPPHARVQALTCSRGCSAGT